MGKQRAPEPDVIERFYAALERCPRDERTFPVSSRLPVEQQDGEPDGDGWTAWKVLRNAVPHDYSRIETLLPAPLPATFKRWHSAGYTVDLDFGPLRLDPVPYGKPLAALEEAASAWTDIENGPLALGLIPIGSEANDAGPLCFDTTADRPNGEWPITYWDHDSQEKGPVICSSFAKLLELAVLLINNRGKENAVHASLQAFVELDPDGAGSAEGFEYWDGFDEDGLVASSSMRVQWAAQNKADDFYSQRALLLNASRLVDEGGEAQSALAMLERVRHPALQTSRTREELKAFASAGETKRAQQLVCTLAEQWLSLEDRLGTRNNISSDELLELLERHGGASGKVFMTRIQTAAANEPC